MNDRPENKPIQSRVPATAWRPGTSGNPGGRPRVAAEVKELAREHGPRAIERLRELLESQNEAVACRAAESLLDRGFGRSPQSLELYRGREVRVIVDRGGIMPLRAEPQQALESHSLHEG
ncbi:MAG: hypothetical protein FJ244_01690 [Nitrospira sp.]|nr:hypothetical protein [Nitrospira sp.]